MLSLSRTINPHVRLKRCFALLPGSCAGLDKVRQSLRPLDKIFCV